MMSLRNAVRIVRTPLLVLVAAAMTACDPCSGVLACGASADHPYLAVDGQIVETVSGRGVDGVRVEVVRRGGVEVEQASQSTITANGGHWRIEFSATSVGSIDADITIATPDGAQYTAPGIRLTTSRIGGDANVLDRWVDRLWFPNAGELIVRGSSDTRIVGAVVEFHRTGGVHLTGSGVANDVVRSRTDVAGRVPLFSIDDGQVFADSIGNVVGDLIVRRSATDSNVIKNVSIPSSPLYRGQMGILRMGVGPSLDYLALFVSASTGAGVAGVAVSFERTSGIELVSPTFSTVSDSLGRVWFALQPKATGVVQGRLIYRAPRTTSADTLQVSLPTFEADTARLFGSIGVRTTTP